MSDNLTDWNDLHVHYGLDEVRRQFYEQLDSGQSDAPRKLDSSEAAKPAKKQPTENQASPSHFNWRDSFRRTDKGAIKPWAYNIELILSNDSAWQDSLGYCALSYRIIKQRETIAGCKPGEWEDADTSRLKVWLTEKYYFNPPGKEASHALVVQAQKRSFHPIKEYLNGLQWDGVARLDHWLVDALEAVPLAGDGRYLSLAGAKFLIGAVARVMNAPLKTKMDNVLILEGEQGRGKSRVVHNLFGEWYSDAPLQLGDKDAYQNIQGVWGAELAELDSFNKAESTTAKSFFSQMRDRYRPSYGVHAQDFTRQCVFVGTTNQEEYLKDYTGNRRYWPIRCRGVNAQWVADNRNQLWAEALTRFKNGERWWPERAEDKTIDEADLFEREQDARLSVDPWHYPIENFLRELVSDYTTSDVILKEACGKDKGHQTRADQNRVGPIMRAIGWHKERKSVIGSDGQSRQRHVYTRPPDWVVSKTAAHNDGLELPND